VEDERVKTNQTNMKKFVIVILCIATLIACNKRIEDDNVVEEYVSIGFSPTTVEIQESPLCITRSNSNDLYGLQIQEVYGKNDNIERIETAVCWLTDNLSKSSITLKKNKRYFCYLVYVPNGKNILYNTGKNYGSPFFHLGPNSSPEYDKIHYGSYYDMNFASYGASMTKDKNDYRIQANMWNQVDIYYGFASILTTKDDEVNIDLYRMMFGLNINATNFTKGKLVVYSKTANDSYDSVMANDGYVYTLTPSKPSLDVVLELVYMPFDQGSDILNYSIEKWSCNDNLAIDHINDSGKVTPLVRQEFKTQRMIKYSIELDVDELLAEVEDTIKPNIIEDNWSDVTTTVSQ
jgi:hypothetical protein